MPQCGVDDLFLSFYLVLEYLQTRVFFSPHIAVEFSIYIFGSNETQSMQLAASLFTEGSAWMLLTQRQE